MLKQINIRFCKKIICSNCVFNDVLRMINFWSSQSNLIMEQIFKLPFVGQFSQFKSYQIFVFGILSSICAMNITKSIICKRSFLISKHISIQKQKFDVGSVTTVSYILKSPSDYFSNKGHIFFFPLFYKNFYILYIRNLCIQLLRTYSKYYKLYQFFFLFCISISKNRTINNMFSKWVVVWRCCVISK